MPRFTINVSNRSGVTNNYVLTQQLPDITGPASGSYPIIISHGKCPNGASTTFHLDHPTKYYAYAITSDGDPNHGISVDTVVKLPISLGTPGNGGDNTSGDTLQYEVDDGVPNLRRGDSNQGRAGSFQIKTGNNFTARDAKKGHFLIGYGDDQKPFSAFQPEPATSYDITPKDSFFLCVMDLTVGSIMIVERVGASVKIDLENMDSPVNVINNEKGELIIAE